jgi:hypothetical protein
MIGATRQSNKNMQMIALSHGTEAQDWVRLTFISEVAGIDVCKGGTSAMNFYVWSKPSAADIDAIEKLGNPGWNFEQYLKYSLMSETYVPGFDLEVLVNSVVFAASIPQRRTNSTAILTRILLNIGEPLGLLILPYRLSSPH